MDFLKTYPFWCGVTSPTSPILLVLHCRTLLHTLVHIASELSVPLGLRLTTRAAPPWQKQKPPVPSAKSLPNASLQKCSTFSNCVHKIKKYTQMHMLRIQKPKRSNNLQNQKQEKVTKAWFAKACRSGKKHWSLINQLTKAGSRIQTEIQRRLRI